ncbi:corticosteroid 11-beta-dehydrogenase isozyme 1 [Plakobranchus ocellatus]|uniref:Corticosteroid 11-beta-dehydrogenase isozyme 1 n=1 Tax=Plakobranchus ocellatus TaxID=259542 RepID=A0AAV4C7G0_9GAST|nr:corticosteroid 11-beta-dehydrogenase isozyme 1 [Plakobranchus ocellatus]
MMGGLDLVVLNHILPHAIQPFKGDQHDLDLLKRLLDVNFRSYVHLTTHALPKLSHSGGRIVVINSAVGKTAHPHLASYSATKHALDGFFSSLRSQFKSSGFNEKDDDAEEVETYEKEEEKEEDDEEEGEKDKEESKKKRKEGWTGTDSSIRGIETAKQRRLQRWVKPASPTETAQAIVRAAANGQDELYFPWLDVRPLVLLYSIWPDVVDWMMRFLSSQES